MESQKIQDIEGFSIGSKDGCGVEIKTDGFMLDPFIKQGIDVPDIRKMAKEVGVESSVPYMFDCDSLSCRREKDDFWTLCGIQTSSDRVNDLIKNKLKEIIDMKAKLASLKEECENESLLLEDLLTAMGYDEITWTNSGQTIVAKKHDKLMTWKLTNDRTYYESSEHNPFTV